MSKTYFETDANPQLLHGKRIAIIGYGSQGKAHAQNLRDSGADVVLGLRTDGASARAAAADGFTVLTPAEAAKADIVMILTPDLEQKKIFEESVAPNIKPNAMLMFAHGFNIHFGLIKPAQNIDVAMIAPKGPGRLVRKEYERGAGVPCVIAVHQNPSGAAFEKALAYAQAIGGTRGGVIETTFKEETETDLFGEQAVLCGGATELVLAGFETLTNAGYQPEVAYFECLHELKLIVDLLYEGGLQRLHTFVSDTAKYGDLTRGPRVVNAQTRETMKQILTEIQDGTFAREWIAEHEAGGKNYRALMDKDLAHPIEAVGARLRAHMRWLPQEINGKPQEMGAPKTDGGGVQPLRAVRAREFELF